MSHTPFSHTELEVKRHFLQLAREHHARSGREKDTEAELAFELSAALLYMNVADYLAEYLVKGIFHLSQAAVSGYYFGAISVKPSKREQYNIGESMKYLERYDFPRKEDIYAKLSEVNKARNTIAHQILKTKAEDLGNIDKAVVDLAQSTEELINIIDEIQLGMPPKNMGDELKSSLSDSPNDSSK